jgi:ribose transport system substrate-binding protein
MLAQWGEMMDSSRVRPSTTKGLRRVGAYLAVAVALGTAAACSSSSSSAPAQANSASSPAGSASAQANKGTIGIVFDSTADPNEQAIAAGIKKIATPDGYQVTEVNANADAQEANSEMSVLVTRQVKAIVFISFDPTALVSGITAANQANIPVYAVGSGYGHPQGLTGAARQDAGTQETDQMIAGLGRGKAAVLAFTYRAGAPCAVAEQRFDAVMQQHPQIQVTKSDVPGPSSEQFGQNTAAAWLQSHPAGSEPLAIWACYDEPNLGAVVSLKQAGRHDVKVYGAYGQAEAIAAIQSGWYTATWYFDLESDGEHVAKDIASGTFSLSRPDLWQTKTVVVDSANVNAFIKDYPEAIKPQS